MGRIIQKNNGMTTIFTSGEDISLITGQPDTYVLGIDPNTGLYEKLNPDGVTVDLEKDSSGITGGTLSGTTLILDNSGGGNINISLSGLSTGGGISSNLYEVTYSELTTHISNSTLSGGSYYMITDFQTIYDQPDYYVNSINGNINPRTCITKYGSIEPLMVLAISSNTISDMAYQLTYPNDKIKYDWSWTNTEINGTPTKGRITERIDEYNNRTDYDHRNVEFKRYETYNLNVKLTGTINSYDSSTGILISNGDTLFNSELTPGDIIYIDSISNYNFNLSLKISGITDDNTLVTYIDPTFNTFSIGGTYDFYSTTPSGSYLSFKEFYIGQSDLSGYTEVTTFQLDGTTYDNYIGDFSQYNTSLSPISINNYGYNTHFILSNNVFGVNTYSNRISDLCVNNSTDTNFYRNRIYQQFFNNIIGSNFQNNDIGSGFNNNYVSNSFVGNTISNGFAFNTIFSGSFQRSVIYNAFSYNKICHYVNQTNFGNNFYSNKIGSLVTLNGYGFYNNIFINNTNQNIFNGNVVSNIVGESFNYNTLGNNFGYNRIGTNFTYNLIGDDFGYGGSQAQGNVIGDNFENNTIGQYCYNNIIGNFFNYNDIGIEFEHNQIQNYFIGNTIGTGFTSNQIGNYFGNNGSAGAMIQNNIFNDFKYNKIGNFFGNDTNFPIIGGGTNGDGGNIIGDGFQYNEIGDNFIWNGMDLSFTNNKIGDDFWFNVFGLYTNDNVIGNLFVANDGGGLGVPMGDGFISNKLGNYSGFNVIGANFKNNEIGDFFGNSGIGLNNDIADNFNNNKIGNYFGNDGTTTAGGNIISIKFYDNLIGNQFFSNTINQNIGLDAEFLNNKIGNGFNYNTTNGWFYDNQIGNGFNSNPDISDYFNSNTIGNDFNSNPYIGYSFYNNIINDYFESNNIGQDFHYNTIDPSFNNNTTTTNFNSNKIKTQISSIDFTDFYGNLTGFTYSALGSSAADNTYYGLYQDSTTGIGVNASFDIEVSGGVVIGVTGITQGKLYAISNTLTILGSQIIGTDGVDDVVITVTGISQLPSVYESYTCDIFERQGGTKRLSYYDSSDILTITNINE